MPREYEGLVAVITGGASGMGINLARTLVTQGAKVCIADVQSELGEAAAKELNQGHSETVAIFQKCDVTNWDSTRALFSAAVKQFGTVDLAFPNAGISGPGFPGPVDRDTNQIPELGAIHVDLTAVVLTVQAALDVMRAKPDPATLPSSEPEFRRKWRGKIVSTSSQAGLYPLPFSPVYSAAKAGVYYLTTSTALLMVPEKITVNCIAPGMVNTPMFSVLPHLIEAAEKNNTSTPMSTIMKAHLSFLPADVTTTGKICEATQGHTVHREWTPYLNEETGKIWEANFFPEHARGFQYCQAKK